MIEVNPWLLPYKQKFTVAHLLGHFFLEYNNYNILNNKFYIEDTEDNFKFSANKIETLANNFAAELLMPKEFIEHLIYNLKISNVNDIANELGVSRIALTYRLKTLKMIN